MKENIRKKLLLQRNKLTADEIDRRSNLIKKTLASMEEYKNAKSIFFYISFNSEVDTHALINEAILDGKQVLVPKINNDNIDIYEIDTFDNLKKNKFGILEPAIAQKHEASVIDLCIVPGIAFDKKGNRLGFGKGYYDKILKKINSKKIALAYDFQIIENVPKEEYDISMDILVTESGIIKCSQNIQKIMQEKIINGKELAFGILYNIKAKIDCLEKKPCLSVVLVGSNPASESYVNTKKKRCDEIGMVCKMFKLPENARKDEIISLIKKLNSNRDVNGIIVQLPLPSHLDENEIIANISPAKDVDCLTPVNLGNFYLGKNEIGPCTPTGVIRLIESTGINIEGANSVVIGRSNIVGKPAAFLLLKKGSTVTICHSKTKNIAEHTSKADILVVAVGKNGIINADMVKKNAIVIDVGINRVEGKIKGDVDFDSVIDKCSFITPVPGGVGPMTVAMLIQNTFSCYIKQNEDN
ncbi:MAG: 5-formyltetrahydrofolate cyclo-ligase [archaeon]